MGGVVSSDGGRQPGEVRSAQQRTEVRPAGRGSIVAGSIGNGRTIKLFGNCAALHMGVAHQRLVRLVTGLVRHLGNAEALLYVETVPFMLEIMKREAFGFQPLTAGLAILSIHLGNTAPAPAY